MHKFTRLCATALAVVALSAPAAMAQSQAPASDESKPQTQMQDKGAPQTQDSGTSTMRSDAGSTLLNEQSPSQETADDLVGMTVVNNAGEGIGSISDLVIEDASIVGAVVSVGGFLGIGAKNVGVNWSAITIEEREGKKVALIDLTRDELEAAPDFKPYEPAPPAGTGGTGTMSPGTGTGGTGTTN